MASVLTDLATVKGVLSIPTSVTVRDTMLTLLIDNVDDCIAGLLGLSTLSSSSYTDRIDIMGPNIDAVSLSAWPVLAVSSVTDGDSTVSSSDFTTELATGIIRRTDGQYFGYGRSEVVVEYTAGFSSYGGRLKLAANAWVAHEFNSMPMSGLSEVKTSSHTRKMTMEEVPLSVRKYLRNWLVAT